MEAINNGVAVHSEFLDSLQIELMNTAYGGEFQGGSRYQSTGHSEHAIQQGWLNMETPHNDSLNMETSHSESTSIDDTIQRPGAVRINVTGAFIIEEKPTSPPIQDGDATSEGVFHDTRDIRLPHHKAIVSHVAVDV